MCSNITANQHQHNSARREFGNYEGFNNPLPSQYDQGTYFRQEFILRRKMKYDIFKADDFETDTSYLLRVNIYFRERLAVGRN